MLQVKHLSSNKLYCTNIQRALKKILQTSLLLQTINYACAAEAYVLNSASNYVTRFSLVSESGMVATGNNYTTIIDPEDWGTFGDRNNYFYTVSWIGNAIKIFKRDEQTLDLIGQQEISTGVNPWMLTFTPNQQCAFISNYGENTISQFKVDKNSGVLSDAGKYHDSYIKPAHTIISPDGKYMVVVHEGNNLIASYQINYNDCSLQETGYTATNHLLVPTRGKILNDNLYINNSGNNQLVHYKLGSDGSLSYRSSFDLDGIEPMSLSIFDNSYVYCPLRSSNKVEIIKIDPNSGDLTKLGVVDSHGYGPRSATIDASKMHIYVTNQFSNQISEFIINSETGGISYITTVNSGGAQPYGMSIID